MLTGQLRVITLVWSKILATDYDPAGTVQADYVLLETGAIEGSLNKDEVPNWPGRCQRDRAWYSVATRGRTNPSGNTRTC